MPSRVPKESALLSRVDAQAPVGKVLSVAQLAWAPSSVGQYLEFLADQENTDPLFPVPRSPAAPACISCRRVCMTQSGLTSSSATAGGEPQLVLDGHDAVAALDRRDDAADADGEVDVAVLEGDLVSASRRGTRRHRVERNGSSWK